MVSVPASEIGLALAVGFLLLSGLPLRWPRIAIPLGLFLGWTLLSLAFSPDPAGGMTQVNKMIVFLTLLTFFSAVRSRSEIKILFLAWATLGSYTAGLGLFQFAKKWHAAQALHRDFYHYYLDSRITGFQDHWMTFSGQELYVLLMLAAFLLFGSSIRKTIWIWLPCLVVIGTALILSFTRGSIAAAVVALAWLLWDWKPKSLLAFPVLLLLVFLAGPASLRTRVNSLFHPEDKIDSNTHRKIVWRTGWEMVKAHPLLGVGPEEISKPKVFFAYLPKDIPLPLPPGYYQHLHSIYVHYAAERGLPAAVFLTGALLMALFDFRRALKTLPPGRSDRRFILQFASATVVGTMIIGAVDLNLGLTAELTMFLVVMCLGYRAAAAPDEPIPDDAIPL